MDVFGCGQTPVCVEADRLVAGGVVVVAAAGNRGADRYLVAGEDVQGFRLISLTDPGNAQDVITVGSAHARNPHGYGVSYDWDPDHDGDYDAMPSKVVDNDPTGRPARSG